METLLALASLLVSIWGLFAKTDRLLREIRDRLVEIRDRLPRPR